ncbi:hypothetical protein AAVH_17749 [Aphelenchoides avenae]|nr:hypothetical protein AAVH_17749 [Aphelenchus avenae]
MQEVAADEAAAEKRAHILVLSNLPESEGTLASARQQGDEKKVEKLLDALDIQCRPLAIYRVGRPAAANAGGNKRSRFTFVEFPHKSIATDHVYIERALSNEEQEQAYQARVQRRAAEKPAPSDTPAPRTRRWDVMDTSAPPESSGNAKNVNGTVPPSV